VEDADPHRVVVPLRPDIELGGTEPAPDPAVEAPEATDPVEAPEPARRSSTMGVEQARALLEAADPVSYYRSVSALARTSAGSPLQPLPYSAARGYHDPACVVVEPEPAGRETMHLYARAAYPDFDANLLARLSDPGLDHLLNHLHQALVHDGVNVALVTNHGQIIDIALILAALVMAQTAEDRTYGVLGERAELEDVVKRSNLLLSRMVMTRQIFNIPTSEVLQVLCRCYYSVPQTANRRRAKLDPELARANNVMMRHALEENLDRGGQLLAMAASGSQDLRLAAGLVKKVRSTWRQRRGEDPGDAPSLHLQPLYNGTIHLMLACRYVLPVALSFDRAHPACEVGAITRVSDADDCHAVMAWIAQAHQRATGVTTVYHQREDDLLTQVRDVLRS